MNRDLFFKASLVVVGVLLALNLIVSIITAPPLSYAGKQKFEDIQVVSFEMGIVGFFNTKDGKLWIYDGESGECKDYVQLRKLGEPLVKKEKLARKKQKSAISPDEEALAALRNACTLQEMYYIDNKKYYGGSVDKLFDKYKMVLPKGVSVIIVSVTKNKYNMKSFHERGVKIYNISGPGGTIKEHER